MKKTDYSVKGATERSILIGFITDTAFVKLIRSHWQGEGLFQSKWSNRIARWCINHVNKHGKTPGKTITTIYENWAETAKDQETIKYIGDFLESLSDEYSHGNEMSTDYLAELAAGFFNYNLLVRAINEGQDLVDAGKIEEAHEILNKVKKVRLGKNVAVHVLEDLDTLAHAFKEALEPPVIEYPDGLGEFLGDEMQRECFVSFMGPEKRGKSYMLLDAAWRAMLQGKRVAYFELGDLGERAMMRRFACRACQKPLHGKTYVVPKTVELEDKKLIILKTETLTSKGLDFETAAMKFKKIAKKYNRDLLKLFCFSAKELSVEGMMAELTKEADKQWIPDVVVVDYADLLAPTSSRMETRDQVNDTWMRLRNIALEYHCLVLTATQTNSAAYSNNLLTMANFSEDKRKLSYVSGMIGLNATPDEKSKGIMRLNWIVRRNGAFTPEKCCHIAGCISIANPAMRSVLEYQR